MRQVFQDKGRPVRAVDRDRTGTKVDGADTLTKGGFVAPQEAFGHCEFASQRLMVFLWP